MEAVYNTSTLAPQVVEGDERKIQIIIHKVS
jgi:hypothetical protein